jgi:hypothetical protein
MVTLSLGLVSTPMATAADVASEAASGDAAAETPAPARETTASDTPTANIPRDPFTYGASEDAGYVRVAHARIPSDIQLLGVIVMKDEEPIAAISVPGASGVLFVNEGSVVQVVAPTPEGTDIYGSEPLYIFINKITANEVEVSPRTRPEDKRILR